ncbi:unnamed protein product [Parascedosporium putredinis]|uniref:MOSC domain-containing protein n=1 Tax=Parascedosporium putredinis TaxID=1442378 RepID=A0A9P1H5I8_9PEZI|nr:unnamed protein product [Parascedosporium putredinis]CAI7997983.1 unnamed protein product [Parascedosporium putredinis]
MYSPDTPYESLSIDAGPIVAFNLRSSGGEWVNLGEFEKLAGLKKIHVRTGGVCSPGGIAAALGLTPSEIRRNYASGVRCNGHSDFVTEKPTGIIRASLGAMSVESDVDRFVDFISDFYCQREAPPKPECAAEASKEELPARLEVKDIIVYPIKSCGGYHVPSNLPWRIKPEGLAWDRDPPESDSEPSIPLLLSNESPILVVHMASVSFLNDVLALTHKPVPAAQFRPNIIVGSKADTPALAAFSEESWRGLTFSSVGRPSPRKGTLRVLGKCYRCQMVCVDQDTGERGEEPFVTLARTRRVGERCHSESMFVWRLEMKKRTEPRSPFLLQILSRHS